MSITPPPIFGLPGSVTRNAVPASNLAMDISILAVFSG
jgi:hypothetical protein